MFQESDHLTPDEIEAAYEGESGGRIGAHLRDCAHCRTRVEERRSWGGKMQSLQDSGPFAALAECPSLDALAQLAAGLDVSDAERIVEHAIKCERCAAILKSSFDLSEDSAPMTSSLRTARPEWQKSMAAQFAERWQSESPKSVLVRPKRFPMQWVAIAAGVVLLLGAALWWQRRQDDPEMLLASAFAETRPFEYRLPGNFGKVQSPRAAGGAARPESLLRAEAEIERRAKAEPDSVELLSLRGRSALMDRRADDAVADLLRASELTPAPAVLVDLGVAFALRAETDTRSSDYAPALDALLRALRAEPGNARALFNLAIVYERVSAFDKAIETWQRFLALEPQGPWADEARRLLERVTEEGKARQSALLRVPEDPARFLQMANDTDAEFLQNAFWAKWLPAAGKDRSADEAASQLSRIWVSRFGDHLLEDAYRQASHLREPALLADMGSAIDQNIHGHNDEVLTRAEGLATKLASQGQRAAALRMRLELAYSYRRSARHEPCLAVVGGLLEKLKPEAYPWLMGRTRLEHSTCIGRAGGMGQARVEREQLEAFAEAHGLKGLALQARELVGSIDSLTGNSAAVWNRAPRNLASYWESPAAEAQAQQPLYDMSNAARSMGYAEAAVAMEAAAVAALVRWDNLALEAVNRVYLASLLQEAGHHDEAVAEFDRAEAIYRRLPPGTTVTNQILAGRLRRAEAEAAGSAPASAIANLDALSPKFSTVEAQMRLQQARGIALVSLGDPRGADACFRNAIQLADKQAGTFTQSLSRVAAMEMATESRRNLVQLALRDSHDPAMAFQLWEQRWHVSGLPPADMALVYAVLPAGVAAWIVKNGKIRGGLLPDSLSVLRAEVSQFVRLCASPASDLAQTRALGGKLYESLVGPYAKDLQDGGRLLIESDGFLAAIPFGALPEGGGYLSDAHAIAIATSVNGPGTEEGGFSHATRAAIVIGTQGGRAFPFLPDARREGNDLRARLEKSEVLEIANRTPERIANEMARAELVHFAGHGWSNGGNAALVLGSAADGTLGVLTATELASRDWRGCRLAVLSACLTAEGEQKGPVNPQSLVRALLAAGARRVVAARWSIDGDSTTALMRQFYDHLFAGASPAVALAKAAGNIRTRRGWEHPYFWAGFDVYSVP